MFAISGCGDGTDQAAAGQCDRQCLEGLMNVYLDAMVAHDVSMAPFADNARFTENAKEIFPMKTPEGLWADATGDIHRDRDPLDPHDQGRNRPQGDRTVGSTSSDVVLLPERDGGVWAM